MTDKSQGAADLSDDQLAALGGERDDIDSEDFADVDRGDSLDPTPPTDDKKDDKNEEEEESEKEEEEQEEEEESEKEEEESEKEEEESEKEEEEQEDDKKKPSSKDNDRDPQGIPKWRFDEVNERRKAAEEELRQYREREQARDKAKEERFDFDAAEKEYMELLLDGQTEKALEKRKDIRAAERAEFETSAVSKATSQSDEKAIKDKLDSITQEAEELFPVFDPEHKDFDPDISDKVVAYFEGYCRRPPKGVKTAADALIAAIADVAEAYGLEERYVPKADDKSKEKDSGKDSEEDESKKGGKKKTGKKSGKKAGVKDKLDLAEQQHTPAAAGGKGSNSGGAGDIDIETMSDEELEALPAATLARLRGDLLE